MVTQHNAPGITSPCLFQDWKRA